MAPELTPAQQMENKEWIRRHILLCAVFLAFLFAWYCSDLLTAIANILYDSTTCARILGKESLTSQELKDFKEQNLAYVASFIRYSLLGLGIGWLLIYRLPPRHSPNTPG